MKILSVFFTVAMLFFTASCDEPAETNKTINISVDYKFDGNRLIFFGESNLPSGTKMGINLTEINLTESFRGSDAQGIDFFTDESGIFYGSTSQDFDIYIDDNGSFESTGFSRQGDKVYGKYVFELLIYNNAAWQTPEVQRMLDNYEMNASTGVVPGKEVTISNNMDFGMTEEQGADLLKRKNTIEEFTSIIQPQLQAETKELWERLNKLRRDPEYHFYGFSQFDGRDWLNAQIALQEKWDNATGSFPAAVKLKYDTSEIIYYMKIIAQDWFRKEGRTSEGNQDMVRIITDSISRNGIVESD